MMIEQKVTIDAPLDKVWQAIIDHNKFGQWFCCKLDQPFKEGNESTGMMTYPGSEHVRWEAKVLTIKHEESIEFSWPGYIADESIDLAKAPWLKGKFEIESTSSGTLLTITESGFEKLPAAIVEKVIQQNKQGWEIQANHIREFVTGAN